MSKNDYNLNASNPSSAARQTTKQHGDQSEF
jgi:hypothetical protein